MIARKASPPGKDGIESITALGNANASPISNFYCKGYLPMQKYWIDKIEGGPLLKGRSKFDKRSTGVSSLNKGGAQKEDHSKY